MPVRVRSHLRRKNTEFPDETTAREAKVIVYTPGDLAPPQKMTIREKLKRDFALPSKRKRVRKKTPLDEFADDADRLATQLERMG